MTPSRTNARTGFAILVDGSEGFGSIKSVRGGAIRGQLATGALRSSVLQRKQINAIAYDDFVLEVGLDGAEGLLQWISTSFAGRGMSRTGEIHTTGVDHKSTTAREFFSAVITEVTVPTCDWASNEINYLTVNIETAGLRYPQSKGEQIKVPTLDPEKQWLSSNFRVELDKLPTDHISKIDSFVWKQGFSNTDEETRQVPSAGDIATIEVPNVRFTMGIAHADDWVNMFNDFVVNGNSGKENEMNGRIEFLSPDLKHTLGSVELLQVGLLSLVLTGAVASAEQIVSMTVELYCQDMQFHYAGSA